MMNREVREMYEGHAREHAAMAQALIVSPGQSEPIEVVALALSSIAHSMIILNDHILDGLVAGVTVFPA